MEVSVRKRWGEGGFVALDYGVAVALWGWVGWLLLPGIARSLACVLALLLVYVCSHGDVDLYVSSRKAFASFVGCQYTGTNDVQCWVSCGDGRLVHLDVHDPEETVQYFPPAWGRDMLATREVSVPADVNLHQGIGGVYRPSDVHYYHSLLYHEAYHKKAVKEDYVPILQKLAARLGAKGWAARSFRSVPDVKALVDAWLACKGYVVDPAIPFEATPDCTQ